MNLARPFKAGTSALFANIVASATVETLRSIVADATDPTSLFNPGLKRPG